MAAALHGAKFPLAKKLRASMTKEQLREYAMLKTEGPEPYDWRRRNNLKRGRSRG